MNRGDVVLVRFPHPSGQRGKKRPAVVVQSDGYANTVGTVVVVEVTKNLTMKDDPGCVVLAARDRLCRYRRKRAGNAFADDEAET